MSDDTTLGTTPDDAGQAGGAPVDPASAPAPDASTAGQPPGGDGPATPADGGQPIDPVFDPAEFDRLTKDLPDEVKNQVTALKKLLQGNYTKKTQALATQRQAYDAISADPLKFVQETAQRLGYQIAPAQNADPNTSQGWNPNSGDPSDWNQVINHIRQEIMGGLSEQLKPMVAEFQNTKRKAIETQLSEIDPSWQTYEDAMSANLQKHPSLAMDPSMLYRVSVPSEILESRATQRALSRMEKKTQSASVSGTSTTNKKIDAGRIPNENRSFAQAVELAKAKLREDGITPP